MDDARRAAAKDATERAVACGVAAASAAAATRAVEMLMTLGSGKTVDAGIERTEQALADLARRNSKGAADEAEQAADEAEQAALYVAAPSRGDAPSHGPPPAADAGIIEAARAAARAARAAADEARAATRECRMPMQAAQ